MVKVGDIQWAAGFLDGEGCFYFNRNTCRVQVAQKDPWPLLKLQKIIGGRLYRVKGSCESGRFYHALFATGKHAAGAMMTMYSLLSPRRQEKIRECLAKWRLVRPRGECHTKTHCIRGHEFTPENTYLKTSGKGRECRACIRIHHETHQAKKEN